MTEDGTDEQFKSKKLEVTSLLLKPLMLGSNIFFVNRDKILGFYPTGPNVAEDIWENPFKIWRSLAKLAFLRVCLEDPTTYVGHQKLGKIRNLNEDGLLQDQVIINRKKDNLKLLLFNLGPRFFLEYQTV